MTFNVRLEVRVRQGRRLLQLATANGLLPLSARDNLPGRSGEVRLRPAGRAPPKGLLRAQTTRYY